jgi:hypothetical protein
LVPQGAVVVPCLARAGARGLGYLGTLVCWYLPIRMRVCDRLEDVLGEQQGTKVKNPHAPRAHARSARTWERDEAVLMSTFGDEAYDVIVEAYHRAGPKTGIVEALVTMVWDHQEQLQSLRERIDTLERGEGGVACT